MKCIYEKFKNDDLIKIIYLNNLYLTPNIFNAININLNNVYLKFILYYPIAIKFNDNEDEILINNNDYIFFENIKTLYVKPLIFHDFIGTEIKINCGYILITRFKPDETKEDYYYTYSTQTTISPLQTKINEILFCYMFNKIIFINLFIYKPAYIEYSLYLYSPKNNLTFNLFYSPKTEILDNKFYYLNYSLSKYLFKDSFIDDLKLIEKIVNSDSMNSYYVYTLLTFSFRL